MGGGQKKRKGASSRGLTKAALASNRRCAAQVRAERRNRPRRADSGRARRVGTGSARAAIAIEAACFALKAKSGSRQIGRAAAKARA